MEKSEEKHAHLVIDQFFREASERKAFLALLNAGRQRNAHLMVLAIQLTLRTEFSKTIDSKVTQVILFNSSKPSEQIGVLGRQLPTLLEKCHILNVTEKYLNYFRKASSV